MSRWEFEINRINVIMFNNICDQFIIDLPVVCVTSVSLLIIITNSTTNIGFLSMLLHDNRIYDEICLLPTSIVFDKHCAY